MVGCPPSVSRGRGAHFKCALAKWVGPLTAWTSTPLVLGLGERERMKTIFKWGLHCLTFEYGRALYFSWVSSFPCSITFSFYIRRRETSKPRLWTLLNLQMFWISSFSSCGNKCLHFFHRWISSHTWYNVQGLTPEITHLCLSSTFCGHLVKRNVLMSPYNPSVMGALIRIAFFKTFPFTFPTELKGCPINKNFILQISTTY